MKRSKQSHLLILILIKSNCNKYCAVQYTCNDNNNNSSNRVLLSATIYATKPVVESGRTIRGCRQRMHAVWKEKGLPKITEQRLCDQARAIRRSEWFTSVELYVL